MDLGLKGRSALVTGSSRGIGLAIAQSLAAEGCNVRLAARDQERLLTVKKELCGLYGVEVQVFPGDLSEQANVIALGEACGDVDILVNNAGGIPRGTLREVDTAPWKKAWDLKVFGFVDLTRIILPKMCARGKGVIINVIGSAGERPNQHYIAGCMANAALNMFTQCLAGESIRHGVRVVSVNPGPVMSDRFLEGLHWRAEKRYQDRNRWPEILAAELPSGRAGTPEEVADAVVFLASDRASYISGGALRIDGGFTVRPTAF